MADSNIAGFGFDPRTLRQPFSPRFSWPNQASQFHSPQQPTFGANANPVNPSATPLPNHRTAIQPINHQCQLRPQSRGHDHGYSHSTSRQTHLPAQVSTSTPFQFDQQLGQQQAFPSQYRSQPQSFNQPMHTAQAIPTEDQSNTNDWAFDQTPSTGQAFPLSSAYPTTQLNTQSFMPYGSSSVNFIPDHTPLTANMNAMDNTYLALNPDIDGVNFNWQDLSSQLSYGGNSGLPDMTVGSQNFPNSPTDTSLEVRSLSSSDNGWVELAHYDGSFPDNQAIFNPGETLHGRTFSDSSYSDAENHARLSWGSYVDVGQHAIGSPGSDSVGGFECQDHSLELQEGVHIKQEQQTSPILTTSTTLPIKIKASKSPQRSPIRRNSPPARRQPRKNSMKAAAKATTKKQIPAVKVETEKRVGRRRGPLRPEQRKQASEIRKLGACLRCKFLKKTCDTQETCQGCLPSHARLWQVPCTRIDIKDIAYFMKDWKADVDRERVISFSVDNIKGFARPERRLFISHGYGHIMPIYAREIYVRDEQCFDVDWVETYQDKPTEHSVNTAKMSLGMEGIPDGLVSEYLDRYLDDGYEAFIDQYFEGTPFITEMLITVYRYYQKEPTAVLRKTLKFLLAYNLTQHVTYVEGIPSEESFMGRIFDDTSKFNGKTVAPVMINFSVKIAMAKVWRQLQKEVLEELSSMYSSVYSKEKLRHWPTIFMVACILLAVWEEMQFDCHYRVQDKDEVNKFCSEMESIPVKVVVGLFHAISQKLPALQEWDTRKHHVALNSNQAICDALTQVRQHVTRHGWFHPLLVSAFANMLLDQYLRSRCDTKFDSDDFDSLSSKFMSKLVIRTPAA